MECAPTSIKPNDGNDTAGPVFDTEQGVTVDLLPGGLDHFILKLIEELFDLFWKYVRSKFCFLYEELLLRNFFIAREYLLRGRSIDTAHQKC